MREGIEIELPKDWWLILINDLEKRNDNLLTAMAKTIKNQLEEGG